MILLISRAERFSPNCVDKDRSILQAVEYCIRERGMDVMTIHEDELTDSLPAALILSMARSEHALSVLRCYEQRGLPVINSTAGSVFCAKRLYASHVGHVCEHKSYWLKRTDTTAHERGDVCFAKDARAVKDRLSAFHRRGINDVQITEHVEGDVVKFYGVSGTGFFRIYYPADDGQTKFGDELINGEAHHYTFSVAGLHRVAESIAHESGVIIYGGDCIVKCDGNFVIIDFNDWPSFSRCRDEAAEAIMHLDVVARL